MSKILLTVILWLPGTPEPQLWEVVAIPFSTIEECERTGAAWADETFKIIEEYSQEYTKDEIVDAYCSSGDSLEGKFEGQTNML